MNWEAETTSDALTLSGSYQVVQAAAADMVIDLTPNETLSVTIKFDPQALPTEHCVVLVEESVEATPANWGTVTEFIVSNDSPNMAQRLFQGHRRLRFRGKLIDTDGTVGGDDTTSTLTVIAAGNGVGS